MSVGRNNYLVICCQSGKCIFFPVHLEGTSLSSFPLFSLWGCFLFCTSGFFAMHTGKYWFSPASRIHKSSAVLCAALQWCIFSTAQDHCSAVYWTPCQNRTNFPVTAINAIFLLSLLYEPTLLFVLLHFHLQLKCRESQRYDLFAFDTCPKC